MDLVTLGGSGAGGNTGQGCSGYLVRVGQTSVVLDLGPGTLPVLRRHADFRTLDAIVISHVHLDHVLDLLALRFALAYNPVPPARRIPLWMPPGSGPFIEAATAAFAPPGDENAFFSNVFDLAEYDPDSLLTIGPLRIRFCPTRHFIPCWAMRIAPNDEIGDLIYTADTGPAADLVGFASGARVLISEANSIEPAAKNREERGHLTAKEAGTIAQAAGVERLVLTHLWEEIGFDAYRKAAAEAFTGKIDVATPGYLVEWS